MNLIISFSGRAEGNCDQIGRFIAKHEDKIVYFRKLNVHACSNCEYECFTSACRYRSDDIYQLYDEMAAYDKIFLIVPMYCGNPASLYFKFNERCQDYFMQNEESYESFLSKLYIIGVYGSQEETPDFVPCLEKWFGDSCYRGRVFGIERRKYNQKMNDKIINLAEIKKDLIEFIEHT